jgi:large subunit ribosomal protein L9
MIKVILKETINSLGIIGSEVRVADGYARNYLLPQEKAVLATPQNRRKMENERAKFEIQIAKESAKVSEEDRLYGSVTARDIIDALAAQDIVVEKRMILLKEPLKTVGSFRVPIRVYNEVEPEITVEISPE